MTPIRARDRHGSPSPALCRYAEQFANLFPASWRVSLAITREFCAITHGHLEEILDQSRGSLDAAVLTHALQKTVEFEKEVRSLWRAEIRVSQLLTRVHVSRRCTRNSAPR